MASAYKVTCPGKGINPSHVEGQPVRAFVLYTPRKPNRPDLSPAFLQSLVPHQAAYAITENAGRTFDVWYLAQPDESGEWNPGSWSQGHAEYFRALFPLLAAVESE